ncbi:Outer membrane protein slp [Methylacidimicrobium cyclopophantes]|uniref:Outer membrane protein slp n=1 Tax=Methylacidimicrobium cyclopophantes TaxID=1041766 RepID=A0A5E6MDW1_9BACT|nr:Slp family lipoprotein [Methylacidimicrobium cyclopophantes]VVM07162.1 Outer membrane protein slp [Methylacidimicrobium cyclopophantes]
MDRFWLRETRPAGLLLLLLLAGCSPFSSEVRKQIRDQPSFGAIRANPSAYRGRMVLLGGTILYAKHRNRATFLEILEKELNAYDHPVSSDKSDGRFLVGISGSLDLSTYAKGREITVIGRVVGPQPGRIGERRYIYPLIAATKIHLWRQHEANSAYWTYPRMEWGWGYPGMDWGTAWGMVPPMTFW